MNSIHYGRQHITDEDIQAVIETLKSDKLTQGPKVREFEEAFASYVGSKYALAVSNGTAALHLSTKALGLKDGNNVITTPITFAASANCIRYCGGEVVFSDIDPNTYLLDIKGVKKLLEDNPKGHFKGILTVDFAGRAVNLEEFRKLANEYNLWILQDSCHSPGGYFIDSKGKKQNCGNGKFADLSIFSFHPVKHIATGEGGMITTNDLNLYQKIYKLRTHGMTKNQSEFQNSIEFAIGQSQNTASVTEDFPNWYMEMQDLGYNYRITDFQCALGISQLKRANKGIEQRKKIAKKYSNAFKNKKFLKGQSRYLDGHAYHLYVIEVEDRLGLYNHLRNDNIFAQVHYIPCHLMPFYQKYGWKEGDMPNAENYYKHCLSLPIYPTLTNDQQDYIINSVLDYYL